MRVLRDAGAWNGRRYSGEMQSKKVETEPLVNSLVHPASAFWLEAFRLYPPPLFRSLKFVRPRRLIFKIPPPIDLFLQEVWRDPALSQRKMFFPFPPSSEKEKKTRFEIKTTLSTIYMIFFFLFYFF